MTEHTPTPWKCDWGTIPPDGPGTYCDVYVDGGETIIARVNDCIECGHANAALIVKAVNNHEDLVKALTDALCELTACANQLAARGLKGHDGDSVSRAQTAARDILGRVGSGKQP